MQAASWVAVSGFEGRGKRSSLTPTGVPYEVLEDMICTTKTTLRWFWPKETTR